MDAPGSGPGFLLFFLGFLTILIYEKTFITKIKDVYFCESRSKASELYLVLDLLELKEMNNFKLAQTKDEKLKKAEAMHERLRYIINVFTGIDANPKDHGLKI